MNTFLWFCSIGLNAMCLWCIHVQQKTIEVQGKRISTNWDFTMSVAEKAEEGFLKLADMYNAGQNAQAEYRPTMPCDKENA